MIIKKLNSMFHKHSRWLFGGFTIVIIVSFMGFLTPGQFGCDGLGSGLGRSVGSVYGENVTLRDLQDRMRDGELLAYIGIGMGGNLTPVQAFQQQALMIAARRQGLAVSNDEVVKFLQQLPVLQENGKYSPELYKKFKDALVRQGIGDEQLVDAVRGVLLIGKLEAFLGGEAIVTDNELETYFRQFNVKYDVKAAAFNADAYLKDVKNDGAAMKAYFEENIANYQIPGKISGLVVTIPNAGFTKAATDAATDAELRKFFETRPWLFEKNGKDGKAPEFEECKSEVKAEYIKNAVRDLALRRAYEFASVAYDAVNNTEEARDVAFRKAAADAKFNLVETGLVDFNATTVGKINSPELLKNLIAAFETHWVTNPVADDEAVYVGFARERILPRPAEFNEVSEQVAKDYRRSEAMKLAVEAAMKAEESLAVIEDGKARLKAFGELKGCEFKDFSFVFGSEMPPMEFIDSALAAARLRVDEVSKVLNTADGAQLAILVKRTPADMKGFAEKKEALRAGVAAMKRQAVQGVFWEELMAQSQLEPELAQQQ
ncbi:SurA N-terminal domain-containing protein [uncultured Victivallis sp.]|uniref:SurA N-terminal domain-containing protein n=1 Tax=uncultured Victivallis sp. TaxID=354118 RepID=UPI0025DB2D92|nr:SurA N-terminal domain-containing protein [uncultured Victivallis sp.]